jgi:hypothetical protein
MKYNLEQYKTLAERFNAMSFLQKIMTVKQQDIFILEVDNHSNFFLRLDDNEAMQKELDLLFEFPQELSGKEFKAIFDICNINLKVV